MTKTFDESVETNHNQNWIFITNHSNRILILAV